MMDCPIPGGLLRKNGLLGSEVSGLMSGWGTAGGFVSGGHSGYDNCTFEGSVFLTNGPLAAFRPRCPKPTTKSAMMTACIYCLTFKFLFFGYNNFNAFLISSSTES